MPTPLHPWTQTLLHWLQDVIRFAIWTALILNLGMAAIFGVWFIFKFLRATAGWADRVLFSNPW